MTDTSTETLVLVLVIAMRLLIPLAIPRYPLPAILAALIVDAVDQTVFEFFLNSELDQYQSYDKALDVYYLTIAYLSTMRNWQYLYAFEISRFLFYYRLVGVVLFEEFEMRSLLLIFPNTFEYFFVFYEAVRTRWNPMRMSKRFILGVAAFIWIVIKLPQEYWIHVAQLDTTDLIKEDLFNASPETGWGTIIADYPLVFVGFGVVLVALALVARRVARRVLPPPDWSFSLDADANGHDVDQSARDDYAKSLTNRLFDRELVEKTVLISLVSVTFVQILPNLTATVPQVAAGIGILIVINAAVSEHLARRGFGWQSAFRQFVTMVAINAAIVIVYSLLPLRSGSLDLESLLFYILLLSLLITFYDRYRPIYLARFGDERRGDEPRGVA